MITPERLSIIRQAANKGWTTIMPDEVIELLDQLKHEIAQRLARDHKDKANLQEQFDAPFSRQRYKKGRPELNQAKVN